MEQAKKDAIQDAFATLRAVRSVYAKDFPELGKACGKAVSALVDAFPDDLPELGVIESGQEWGAGSPISEDLR